MCLVPVGESKFFLLCLSLHISFLEAEPNCSQDEDFSVWPNTSQIIVDVNATLNLTFKINGCNLTTKFDHSIYIGKLSENFSYTDDVCLFRHESGICITDVPNPGCFCPNESSDFYHFSTTVRDSHNGTWKISSSTEHPGEKYIDVIVRCAHFEISSFSQKRRILVEVNSVLNLKFTTIDNCFLKSNPFDVIYVDRPVNSSQFSDQSSRRFCHLVQRGRLCVNKSQINGCFCPGLPAGTYQLLTTIDVSHNGTWIWSADSLFVQETFIDIVVTCAHFEFPSLGQNRSLLVEDNSVLNLTFHIKRSCNMSKTPVIYIDRPIESSLNSNIKPARFCQIVPKKGSCVDKLQVYGCFCSAVSEGTYHVVTVVDPSLSGTWKWSTDPDLVTEININITVTPLTNGTVLPGYNLPANTTDKTDNKTERALFIDPELPPTVTKVTAIVVSIAAFTGLAIAITVFMLFKYKKITRDLSGPSPRQQVGRQGLAAVEKLSDTSLSEEDHAYAEVMDDLEMRTFRSVCFTSHEVLGQSALSSFSFPPAQSAHPENHISLRWSLPVPLVKLRPAPAVSEGYLHPVANLLESTAFVENHDGAWQEAHYQNISSTT